MRRLRKKIGAMLWVCLCVGSVWGRSSNGPMTLDECFARAVAQSAGLQRTALGVETAQAHRVQALGVALPHLSIEASEAVQDAASVASTGSSSDSLIRQSRPEVAVQLTQPIFQGFREFQALKIAGAERRKAEYTTTRARERLFADVATAYYAVLEREQDARIVDAMRRVLAERVAEVRARVVQGRSRESELAANQAELAAVAAEVAEARGAVQVARAELGYYIGEDPPDGLRDTYRVPGRLPALEHYLAPVATRSDIRAAEADRQLAAGVVRYERGARWPTANLQARYYPYRVGFYQDVTWDLLFGVSIPITTSGATRGRILEAQVDSRARALAATDARRRAETDVRKAYAQLRAGQAQSAARHEAARRSEQHYRAQSGEYALNLTTYVNVLQAMREWYAMQRLANAAQYRNKLSYLQLLVAAGTVLHGVEGAAQ